MEPERPTVPESWVSSPLTAVCDILDHQRIPINNGERNRRIAGKLSVDLYPYYGATGQVGVIDDFIFEGEHILLGEDGAPFLDPLRDKAYLVNGRFWVNNHAHILRSRISNKYVCHYLNAIDYSNHVTGTTRLKLTKGALGGIPIPIPTMAEQLRIVAKIEELFSELDKGIESLKRVHTQLDIYRQSVLKYAFDGKLTVHWREANRDILETPEKLLTRILNKRTKRYSEQIDDWKNAVKEWFQDSHGKKPPRPRPLSIPDPFTDLQLEHLPDIPSVWRWTKLGELFAVYVGATPNRKNRRYWNGEINWISSGEVCFNTIDSTVETITQEGLASTSTEVHPIGTVMLGMIGEGKTRGRAAITNIEVCHNQNTAAVRVSEAGIPPKYVYYYLLYRYEDTRRIGSGNNQRALNKERVSNLPIPLPSLDEQSVLVEGLNEHLLTVEQIEREIVSALTRTYSLRQAILKWAFSGQLVPQDPRDEPASVLLDRIKAEREQITNETVPRKTRKRGETRVTR